MKIKIITLLLLCMLFAVSAFSQKLMYANKEYKIKGEKIFFEGKDVSDSFSAKEKVAIFNKLKVQKVKNKEEKKQEKEVKKEKKKIDKAEKKQKKQEKILDDYDNAVDKLETAQAKYERLKRKGKLSPNDEVQWLDKIAKLKEKVSTKKKKLK
jgi:predicted RNase H-like nuclease (RuvC/YqgF family)